MGSVAAIYIYICIHDTTPCFTYGFIHPQTLRAESRVARTNTHTHVPLGILYICMWWFWSANNQTAAPRITRCMYVYGGGGAIVYDDGVFGVVVCVVRWWWWRQWPQRACVLLDWFKKSLSRSTTIYYTQHNRSVVETAATKKKTNTFFFIRATLSLSLSVAQSILFFRRRARATSYDTALRVCVVCVLHKSLRFLARRQRTAVCVCIELFGEVGRWFCLLKYILNCEFYGWTLIARSKLGWVWRRMVNASTAPYIVWRVDGFFFLLGNVCAKTTLLPKSRKTWCNNSD